MTNPFAFHQRPRSWYRRTRRAGAALGATAGLTAGMLAFSSVAQAAAPQAATASTPTLTPAKTFEHAGSSLDTLTCSTTQHCIGVVVYANGDRGVVTSSDGGASWTTSASGIPSMATVRTVSCATSTDCMAFGASTSGGPAAAATTDGGTTWSSVTLPAGGGDSSFAVGSCMTSGTCLTDVLTPGTDTIERTTDLGSTWAPLSTFSSYDGLSAMSCNGMTCLITTASGEVFRSGDGGTTWTDATDTSVTVYGQGCSSAGTCVVTGESSGTAAAYVSTDDGLTWQTTTVPGDANYLGAVSCGAASTCSVVAGLPSGSAEATVLATTSDGGGSWTEQSVPISVDQLSCTTALDCVTGGDGGFAATTNGGSTWTVKPFTEPRVLNAAACLTTTTCVAVGQSGAGAAVTRTTDGGTTWIPAHVPTATATLLRSVACPSATRCVSVGEIDGQSGPISGSIAVSGNAGVSWTGITTPVLANADSWAVACPTALRCVTVGSTAANGPWFATSGDGGQTWTVGTTTATGIGPMTSVACPTSTICVASGGGYIGSLGQVVGYVLVSTDGGSTWQQAKTPKLWDGGPITCVSATTCFGSFTSGGRSPEVLRTTNHGTTWKVDTQVTARDLPAAASCPTATTCFATGTTTYGGAPFVTSTDGGVTWSTGTMASPVNSLNDIACPSTTKCVAVGLSTDLAAEILTGP